MFAEPIREIEKIHKRKRQWKNKILKPGDNLLSKLSGELFRIQAELKVDEGAEEIGFVIRDVPVVYNIKKQQLYCQKKTAPLKPVNGKINLEILIDRTSIEIFGNNGRMYMPMGVILADNPKSLKIFSRGGNTMVESLIVQKLGSVWQ